MVPEEVRHRPRRLFMKGAARVTGGRRRRRGNMGRVQASARAFTLVELLIVIAVLALLIGILLPGLHGAQRTTRSAVCLSNLRQHATGTSSYAADFADRIWT